MRRTGVRAPWWFLIPAVLAYGFVVVVPSLRGAGYAFTDWDGLNPEVAFVGLENFGRIFADTAARAAIGNTLLFAVAVTVLQNLIGLLLALGVHSKIKSRSVLTAVFFAPTIIAPLVVAYLWQYLLTPSGPANAALERVGLGGLRQDWLGNSDLALWSIVLVICWQFAGYSMVIFLAGLESVPTELLEAAEIDGVNRWQKFWHVVRPLLAPATTINLMLSLIGGFKLFDKILIMTNGGPGTATETLSTHIYKGAFQFGDFAYSIALALVLTVFIALASGIQFSLLRRGEQ
ncbi:carbohydrate ABC transporter permease [Propionibacteriaceae bacterium Y2011]|uniref:carbohydrate ABC transporter permease n=1 Tax=Microlunatus sp. Y2014 TaxID=3418488 RepID=UPI003B4F8C7B